MFTPGGGLSVEIIKSQEQVQSVDSFAILDFRYTK
jgi:hypothetical protein